MEITNRGVQWSLMNLRKPDNSILSYGKEGVKAGYKKQTVPSKPI